MSNNPSSLELIEECLDKIYNARKASLLIRTRRFKEKAAKKKMEAQHHSPSKSHKKILIERIQKDKSSDEEDDDDDQLLAELSSNFVVPPPKSVPYQVSLTEKEEDQADVLFDEFIAELKAAKEDEEVSKDNDKRSEFADYLTDKYLSNQLDSFSSTEKISMIRKEISNMIEDFASSDNLRNSGVFSDFTNPRMKTFEGRNSGKLDLQQLNIDNEDHNIENNKKEIENKQEKSKQTKYNKEQEKIKQKYEDLMKVKKRSESHPDNEAIQQYSELQDDIQSVIQSIQQKVPIKMS